MLDYNIISRKETVSKQKNNKKVTFKDLLTPVINRDKKIYNYEKIYVSKEYVARPDLMSLALYGTDAYADILCKVNGISNPFELNEDMLIYCPSYQEITSLLNNAMKASDLMDENTAVNIAGFRSKEESDTIGTNVKNLKKQKNERRSPAEQTITDNNFVIDRSLGVVIY